MAEFIWNRIEIEPRFYEIDSYNIVNNMYYLSWLEMARIKVAKDAGIMVPKFYTDGMCFVVAESHIIYENAVNFWDKVKVETLIRKIQGPRLEFTHRMASTLTKVPVASATTAIYCLKNMKVIPRIPEWVQAKIDAYVTNVQKGIEP